MFVQTKSHDAMMLSLFRYFTDLRQSQLSATSHFYHEHVFRVWNHAGTELISPTNPVWPWLYRPYVVAPTAV